MVAVRVDVDMAGLWTLPEIQIATDGRAAPAAAPATGAATFSRHATRAARPATGRKVEESALRPGTRPGRAEPARWRFAARNVVADGAR